MPGAVLGWDLGAAMAMAAALGMEPLLAAEVLPDLEAIAVRHMNARMETER